MDALLCSESFSECVFLFITVWGNVSAGVCAGCICCFLHVCVMLSHFMELWSWRSVSWNIDTHIQLLPFAHNCASWPNLLCSLLILAQLHLNPQRAFEEHANHNRGHFWEECCFFHIDLCDWCEVTRSELQMLLISSMIHVIHVCPMQMLEMHWAKKFYSTLRTCSKGSISVSGPHCSKRLKVWHSIPSIFQKIYIFSKHHCTACQTVYDSFSDITLAAEQI